MTLIGAIVGAVSAIFGVIFFLNTRDGKKFDQLFTEQARLTDVDAKQTQNIKDIESEVRNNCAERKLAVEQRFGLISQEIELLKKEYSIFRDQHNESMRRIEVILTGVNTKLDESNKSIDKLTKVMIKHMSNDSPSNGTVDTLIDG